jgi:hypothetical protein
MEKLTIDKRNRYLLLALGTAGVVIALYSFQVQPLRTRLKAAREQIAQNQAKLQNSRRTVAFANQITNEFNLAQDKQKAIEQIMAHGDLYRWVINTFLGLQSQHNVEFTEFSQPVVTDWEIPPKIAYKGVVFTVSGTASYHEFGLFLAGFENRFPYMRLQSLNLEPATGIQPDPRQPGRLTFTLQFSILVKPPPAKS